MKTNKASCTGEVKEEIAFFSGVKPMVGALARTLSAQVASSSHMLLQAVEGGDIGDIRSVLANTEKGLKRLSLLTASCELRDELRTPLMCAVRTGDFAIFKTILHAFDGLFSSQSNRTSEMKRQLLQRDNNGRDVAAHAARAGHAVIMTTVLQEIFKSGALAALTARDYQQMTLVMHAAAAGNAATFQEVVKAVHSVLSAPEMADHMTLNSGDDQTLLMIAAASSDTMTFKACVEALRLAVTPHEFRALMMARDAEAMTFLMHAANPASFTSKSRKMFPQDNDHNKPGSRGGGAPVSRATIAPFGGTRSGPGLQPPSSASEVAPGPGSRGYGGTREDAWRTVSLQKPAFAGTNERGLERDLPDQSFPGEGAYDDEEKVINRGIDVGADDNEPDAGTSDSLSASKAPQQRHPLQKEQPRQLVIPTENGVDLRVLVLKVAVALNRQHLWKEQAREILTARDLWGRTLVSHGILSGNPQVFEFTMCALRADLLDEDVQDLVEDDEQSDRENLLEVAKQVGGSHMAAAVRLQLLLLKRDVNLHAKGSSVEAKIQSFVPGKLIVIFLMLLPEVGNQRETRLGLLLIMSALAPILAWASALVTRGRSSAHDFVPKRSPFSYCLAAPAMFVWGTGTSNIFSSDINPEDSNDPEGYGWDESRAAVVLAVGVIVIPAVDGFVNSKFVGQWNDKFSFSRWRFSRQAELQWNKLRAHANYKKHYDDEQSPAMALAQEKLQGVRTNHSAQASKASNYDPYQRHSVAEPLPKRVALSKSHDVKVPTADEEIASWDAMEATRKFVEEMEAGRKFVEDARLPLEGKASDADQPSGGTEEDGFKNVDSEANRPSSGAEVDPSRAAVAGEAGFQPTATSVVGDEWETLAESLQAGRTYPSKDGDIRLGVQGSSGPGPVRLYHSAQLLRSGGVDYLVEAIVHCPRGATFGEPLLLDFLLDDPDFDHGKNTLKNVLKDYQVLFKKHDDAGWHLMGQADMCLTGDGGATYLRAHVSHFCCFSCGKKIDHRNGYAQGKCRDRNNVKFVNCTNAMLFLVWLPTEFSTQRTERYAVNFSVAAGEFGGGGGGERETHTENILLPAGVIPSSQQVGPNAPKSMLAMRDSTKAERLFVCTMEGEPETTHVTPTVGTPTVGTPTVGTPTVGTPNPPSDTARVPHCDLQRVAFYDSFIVRGGESLALLPKRLEWSYQKCRLVRLSDVVLSHVPLALAGMTVRSDEESKEARTEAPRSGSGSRFSFFSRRNP